MMRTYFKFFLFAFVLFLFGCRTYDSPFVSKTEEELEAMEYQNFLASEEFYRGNYVASRAITEKLSFEMTVSRPLYQLEQVSTLLLEGKNQEAHELMISIRNDLDILFDRQSEEKAISLWHGENNKVFKGDNHERAIFYAFLAMSFIELGEYEDALRCVQNGLLADSSNEEEYSSDFGLLHYLGYVTSRYLNDMGGAEEYKREYLETLAMQGCNVDSYESTWASLVDDKPLPNAFLVLWTGTPPSYVRGGAYEEIRHVIPGKDELTMVMVETPDKNLRNAAKYIGDINFQASTRGGREMDSVLKNKANVKSGLNASGNVFMIAGFACFAAMSGQNEAPVILALGGAGIGCFVVGGGFYYVGSLINSKADIRYWRNLPGNLSIIPLYLEEGDNEIFIHGYYGWDHVIRENCTIPILPGKTTIRHFSLMPLAEQVNTPNMRYMREAGSDILLKMKNINDWMKYEITE